MKKALAFIIITILVCAQIMPYLSVKADTVDLTGLQEKIEIINTLVDEDRQLFNESLGASAGLSMRATGYSAVPASSIGEIGEWVWDRIVDIGDGTRDVAQWCVDKLENIIDALTPDHTSGGHRFAYNPTDTPVYNALYTDDQWNSLVSSWANAQSHSDNFISFADATDDVEGWADRYYANIVNGTTTRETGMTVTQRSTFLSVKPGWFYAQHFSDVDKSYITYCNIPYNATGNVVSLVYEYYNSRWYVHWYDENKNPINNYDTLWGSNTYAARYWGESIPASGTDIAHTLYHWQDGLTTSVYPSGWNRSPSWLSGTWNEATATQTIYNWYHGNSNVSTGRYFNIYCYWKDPNTGDWNPFSVHPGTYTPWTAPTLTPIIIDNSRTYLSVSNNTTITDYYTVVNNITDTTINNETVIYNVFNNTVINYILPDPDYVEGPEPTPEPITPTPNITPTDTPTASPTPTGPIEITGIVEVTNIPTQFDVWVVNPSGSPVPVTIIEPTGQGTDENDWDFGIDIPFPDSDDLTTSSNISNSRLVTSVEQSQGVDLSYEDITGGFLSVIPAGLRDILLIVVFIAIVICFITRW